MRNLPWPAVLAVVALCFLSVLYGAVAVHLDWWPSSTVRDAKLAFEALRETADEELRKRWPPGMEAVETSAATAPQARALVAELPDDLIFVDGGVQQLRSHCPANGCIAWVMNRAGEILHVWDVGPELLWDDIAEVAGFARPENVYSVGAHPFPDGDLLVVYQGRNTWPYGIGIARFDKDSRLLWKKQNLGHHWLSVDEDGLIYTSAFQPREAPVQVGDMRLRIDCPGGTVYEDVVSVLDPDGNEVERFSLLDALVESGYAGLVFQGKHPDRGVPVHYTECDPTHLNDVRVVSRADAAGSTLLEAGDLFVSMRSLNAVALLDHATRRVKWVSVGHTVLQHSPRYLGNESVLVFDNLGGREATGGSRLVRIGLRSHEAETVYPPADGSVTDFFTETAGHIALSPDRRRALVSLTRQGRAVELDLASGEVLWEYLNVHAVDGLARDADGNPVAAGRFALQTLAYFNDADFEFNGGRPATP